MLAASENMSATLARSVPLSRPAHGQATRVQIGRAELVLENRRGSYSLLWSDGREARRYVLGLTEHGQLHVDLRAPRLPLSVVPREVLTVVPGARLRGYITVPLVPTLVWRDRLAQPQTLLELLPKALQGTWHEQHGHAFRCSASWLTRFPFQTGEPHCVVPLRLANVGSEPACPASLPVHLTDDDLVELRGTLLVRPQRLRWNGAERASEEQA